MRGDRAPARPRIRSHLLALPADAPTIVRRRRPRLCMHHRKERHAGARQRRTAPPKPIATRSSTPCVETARQRAPRIRSHPIPSPADAPAMTPANADLGCACITAKSRHARPRQLPQPHRSRSPPRSSTPCVETARQRGRASAAAATPSRCLPTHPRSPADADRGCACITANTHLRRPRGRMHRRQQPPRMAWRYAAGVSSCRSIAFRRRPSSWK